MSAQNDIAFVEDVVYNDEGSMLAEAHKALARIRAYLDDLEKKLDEEGKS